MTSRRFIAATATICMAVACVVPAHAEQSAPRNSGQAAVASVVSTRGVTVEAPKTVVDGTDVVRATVTATVADAGAKIPVVFLVDGNERIRVQTDGEGKASAVLTFVPLNPAVEKTREHTITALVEDSDSATGSQAEATITITAGSKTPSGSSDIPPTANPVWLFRQALHHVAGGSLFALLMLFNALGLPM